MANFATRRNSGEVTILLSVISLTSFAYYVYKRNRVGYSDLQLFP